MEKAEITVFDSKNGFDAGQKQIHRHTGRCTIVHRRFAGQIPDLFLVQVFHTEHRQTYNEQKHVNKIAHIYATFFCDSRKFAKRHPNDPFEQQERVTEYCASTRSKRLINDLQFQALKGAIGGPLSKTNV